MESTRTSCPTRLSLPFMLVHTTLIWLGLAILIVPRELPARGVQHSGAVFHLMSGRFRSALVKLTFENPAISVFTSRLLVREQASSGQVALHRSNMEKIACVFSLAAACPAWWEKHVREVRALTNQAEQTRLSLRCKRHISDYSDSSNSSRGQLRHPISCVSARPSITLVSGFMKNESCGMNRTAT